MRRELKPEEERAIDAAIKEAHLPTLVMSIVHLSGEPNLLEGERPTYGLFDDRVRQFSDEKKAAIREQARDAIRDFVSGKPLPPPPSSTNVQRMINFIAGVDVPERYLPFLLDELKLDGIDRDQPVWSDANRQAACEMFVVVIGAGLSGLVAAIRLRQAGVPFLIVEKNADVGGTWFENTYPGCRVDSTNHMYAYSFAATGHAWPNWYSTQPVLLQYFRGLADEHKLRDSAVFDTEVTDAVYDEAVARWTVRLRPRNGEERVVTATAVISAIGQLNQPRFPDIKGIKTFAGPAFHSAQWRHDVDLRGKRVAVIGTGASAFQIVPSIAAEVGELRVFQRSAPFIMPTKNYHDPVGQGFQWLLTNIPFYEKWWRFFLFWSFTDGVYDAVRLGPDGRPNAENTRIKDLLMRQMMQQLEGAEHLADKIVPKGPFGEKRAMRDNGGWIASMRRDNVHLITETIERITPDAIITKDGERHAVDAIIYGTGFRASEFLSSVKVVGRNGVSLSEFWGGDARAHLGITIPHFPNFFMLFGPNTNIVVNGSVIFFAECAVRYVLSCLEVLAGHPRGALEVRSDVYDEYNARVDARNATMTWGAPEATNWYKNATGRVSQNWPFPIVDYWYATRAPVLEDLSLSAASLDEPSKLKA